MGLNKHIDTIIVKTFNNRASKSEQDKLQAWITSSEKNKKEYESYLQLWTRSKKLILSGSIDVESALKKTKKQITEFNKKKKWLNILRLVAAVVIMAFSLSFLYQKFFEKDRDKISEKTVFQEVNASCGTQTRLNLPDGSTVWLNSGSSLRFPMSFNGQLSRIVELTGEGYFDVTKNAGQPFIVKTPSIDVKVTGTSFNVSAYENEPDITIALISGKVDLVKDYNNIEKKVLELSPLEVATYYPDRNEIAQSKVDLIDKYTAWKEGRIVFYNDPIEKVVSRLENWYNVNIELADSSLNKYNFTATFIDESLEQVLKLLSLSSPMKYEIIPARKNPDNSYGRRNILLTYKQKEK